MMVYWGFKNSGGPMNLSAKTSLVKVFLRKFYKIFA